MFFLWGPDCFSSPALSSDSGQETGGHSSPFPPCWDASRILLRLHAPGCRWYPEPSGAGSVPRAAQPLGAPWADGSNDIPSEMGRFCSGRPEKSQGQRGEVMVAVSGVILPLHSWGPLSDSAVLFRSREPGNTHLRRLPSCSASPLLRFGRLWAGAWGPAASPGGAQHRWAQLQKTCGSRCQHILPLRSCSSEARWASCMGSSSAKVATKHKSLLPKLTCSSGCETGPTAPVRLKSPTPAADCLLTL